MYTYDIENRLIEISNLQSPISYYYDPFGRRLWKEVSGTTTYFMYADEGLVAELDDTGAETKTYGYVPNSTWTTDPLFMKEGTNYYFYHNDHLGTPQKMTSVNGAVVWSAKYSAFGEAEIDSASTVTNNLRYAGQYYDSETGLYYNYNRYYEPSTGRYLTPDPIGLDGGINLFTYVENNSINKYDELGLWVKYCSRGLGNKNKPPTSVWNPLRHDYLNVSGTFVSFQAGDSMIWSQGRVEKGKDVEYDQGRCHTLICNDVNFDKYVLVAAQWSPKYNVWAYPGTATYKSGARNCQDWATEVLFKAKAEYLKNEKCPKCFK